ncbi:MAG: protoglobin domain-containing protein [Oligoflexia bacterium]|nr:protoglobin domain-containing protein [Oligoflexia bacterium]
MTEEELSHRMKVIQFTEEDVARLKKLSPYAREYAEPVIEEFYRHLLSFEEMRAFFPDRRTLDYVKRKQKEYFVRLTEGDYGMKYVEDRLLIGAVHEKIDLPIKTYLAMYAYYENQVASRLRAAFAGHADEAFDVFLSLIKLIRLDMILAIDAYSLRREQTIRQQEEAIRELSTPVLRIRDRLLILPIIGLIDRKRATQITAQLLTSIRNARARVIVIDITGVPVVDTDTANHLVQTVEAARLLGAQVITTGLSSEIAQTIVRLGVDLSRLNTVGDLQGGVEEAERILGYRVIRGEGGSSYLEAG